MKDTGAENLKTANGKAEKIKTLFYYSRKQFGNEVKMLSYLNDKTFQSIIQKWQEFKRITSILPFAT